MRAEQVTAAVAHHGEGAVWEVTTQRLLWVDMLRGDVLSLAPGSSAVGRRHVSDVVACVVPRVAGGQAVATERGFALLAADGGIERLGDLWTDDTVRMNDGACDPQGRFYCGSMAYDMETGRGALYRLDPDRSTHFLFGDVTISNGLGWSPDGAVAYYIDTPTNRIDVFDYDGELHDRRAFVEIPTDIGAPDGLTVDGEGGIWVALWGGGVVRRYDAQGRPDAVVEVAVRQPTSCAFGGANLDVLFVTTSAENSDERDAGALFCAQPGVRGLGALPYAG